MSLNNKCVHDMYLKLCMDYGYYVVSRHTILTYTLHTHTYSVHILTSDTMILYVILSGVTNERLRVPTRDEVNKQPLQKENNNNNQL